MLLQLILFKRWASAFFYILILFYPIELLAQPLTADAGSDTLYCSNIDDVLGGAPSAQGGFPPYAWKWDMVAPLNVHASDFLNDTAHPNPKLTDILQNDNGPMTFRLTVTDSTGAVANDSIVVYNSTFTVNQGVDLIQAEAGETVTLHAPGFSGGYSPYVYDWSPKDYISGASNGTIIDVVVQEQASLNNYSLEVTDKHGCSIEMLPAEIIDLLTGFQDLLSPDKSFRIQTTHRGVCIQGVGDVKLKEVFDLNGQTPIYASKKFENGVLVSGLKNGVYIFVLELNGRQFAKKLVVPL